MILLIFTPERGLRLHYRDILIDGTNILPILFSDGS